LVVSGWVVISVVSCICDAASTSTEEIESKLWLNSSRGESNRGFEDALDLVEKERSNAADDETANHLSTEDCLTMSLGSEVVAPSIQSRNVPTDAFDVCKNDANLSRSGATDGSRFRSDSMVDTPVDSSTSFEPLQDVALDTSDIYQSWPKRLEIPGREFTAKQSADDGNVQAVGTSSTVGTLSLQEAQLGGHVVVESPLENEIDVAPQENVGIMARSSEILIQTLDSQSEVQMVETVLRIPVLETTITDDNSEVEHPTQATGVDAVQNVNEAGVGDANYGRIKQNSNDQSSTRAQAARGEFALEGLVDSKIAMASNLNTGVHDADKLIVNDTPLYQPLPESLVSSTQKDLSQTSASIDPMPKIGGASTTTDTPMEYDKPAILASNEESNDRSYGYTTIWGHQKQHRLDPNSLRELLGKEDYSNSETEHVASAVGRESTEDAGGGAETSGIDETQNIDQNLDITRAPKSVNTEFVEGLDDIDKFLEEVEPPDELDVGAAGSSIQEVLVGQGAQILTKHVTIVLSRLKTSFQRSRLTNFLASRRTPDGKFRIVTADELRRALVMFQRSCKAFARSLQAFWDDLLDDDDDSVKLEIEISHEATKLDSFRQGVLGRGVDKDYDQA
jgi:hypothetical protein